MNLMDLPYAAINLAPVREELSSQESPFANVEFTGFKRDLSPAIPVVTYIIPVHNQAAIIKNNLQSILKCSSMLHEFIIIDDASTDGSDKQIAAWISSVSENSGLTTCITFIKTESDIFETACDSIGIQLAAGEFIIEVQSDMTLREHGFDRLMVNALTTNVDVFAVSGRGIHPISSVVGKQGPRAVLADKIRSATLRATSMLRSRRAYRPSPILFILCGEAGRLGEDINKPLVQAQGRRLLYVGGSVMRGPLAFRRDEYEVLEGFDLECFFLGNDDHDLLSRAAGLLKKTGAYLPIAFDSPTNLGTTRQVRNESKEKRYQQLKRQFTIAAAKSYLESHGPRMPEPKRSVRKISTTLL
ncbi:glycosyltransferase family A protein [Pseudarthrobacter sp. B907]|uniref:glycosyltransferase family A protein n=1 Tax=Pseudarthrobacter sp. B907 TaxID=3158261 RepID=UPI0032DB0AA6